MELKKYNNIITSGGWSNKDSNDAHILALVVVAQKLVYDLKKTSDKSNMESKKLK